MKKSLVVIVVITAVVAVLAMTFGGSYNSLVAIREEANTAWSQVQTQLQRRADLIPNLVETVKGYASQEKEIYTAIADARSKLIGAQTPEEVSAANGELSSALSRLLVIAEAYPQLKSDANFRQLSDELAGTENRIARSREEYNEAVKTYNTKIKSFPTVIFANMFGFEQLQYFEADQGSQSAPKVSF